LHCFIELPDLFYDGISQDPYTKRESVASQSFHFRGFSYSSKQPGQTFVADLPNRTLFRQLLVLADLPSVQIILHRLTTIASGNYGESSPVSLLFVSLHRIHSTTVPKPDGDSEIVRQGFLLSTYPSMVSYTMLGVPGDIFQVDLIRQLTFLFDHFPELDTLQVNKKCTLFVLWE
jgi:hypothetical protein